MRCLPRGKASLSSAILRLVSRFFMSGFGAVEIPAGSTIIRLAGKSALGDRCCGIMAQYDRNSRAIEQK